MITEAHFETALQQYRINDRTLNTSSPIEEGFHIHEHRHLGLTVIRGNTQNSDFVDALQQINIDIPAPLQMTGSPNNASQPTCLWIGPDELWVLVDRQVTPTLQRQLDTALTGDDDHRLGVWVDNSGGFSFLELSGNLCYNVLSHLMSYDFRKLNEGKVVATTLMKAGVTLVKYPEDKLLLLVRNSFSDYVYRLLAHATNIQ